MASEDFGKFLSNLAQKNGAMDNKALNILKEKIEKEKAEQTEIRLKSVFSEIQRNVQSLRNLRKQEKMLQNNIAGLEKIANNIVAGKEEETPEE